MKIPETLRIGLVPTEYPNRFDVQVSCACCGRDLVKVPESAEISITDLALTGDHDCAAGELSLEQVRTRGGTG